MNAKFEELIRGFIDNQFAVCDHFLPLELAVLLQQNLLNLHKSDKMKKAGIGNLQVKDTGQDKRSDKIYWIENKTVDPPELAFLRQIEQFIAYLNETCYVGINDYEFHYAIYESGSSYQRHLDQFNNNNDRKFSLIHYLNTDWLDDDAGELIIYLNDKTEKILPRIQKAVFFRSDHCEHSVEKSFRPRMSISGWLKSV
jgi:SM-20-related protein